MDALAQCADYEVVTDKLMNVVAMIENLTPGVVMLRNLHSGELTPFKNHVLPPLSLQPYHGRFLVVGESRLHGRVAFSVNMNRDFRRRLEFALHGGGWGPYMVNGFTSLVIPRRTFARAIRLLDAPKGE